METNVVGFPWGWNNTVRDSRGNVVSFDFYGVPAATKMVFKLLKYVRSDEGAGLCAIQH